MTDNNDKSFQMAHKIIPGFRKSFTTDTEDRREIGKGRGREETVSKRTEPKARREISKTHLGGDLNVTRVDSLDNVVRGLTVDGASNRLSGTEDLLDTVGEVLGEGLLGLSHSTGDLDDLVEFNVTGVLDVLLLLAVTNGLLEGTDDERGSRGDDRDGSLTVLDRKLNGNTETFPVTGSLGDVLTDLLGGLLSSTVRAAKRSAPPKLRESGKLKDDT
jgi:hypothetical protein